MNNYSLKYKKQLNLKFHDSEQWYPYIYNWYNS